MSNASGAARFTEKQGEYLAFIYTYVLLHRQPPSVHPMMCNSKSSA